MDPGLEEPISTILWATPRMSSDIPELREVRMEDALFHLDLFSLVFHDNGAVQTSVHMVMPPCKHIYLLLLLYNI